MPNAHDGVETALAEVERLRKYLKRGTGKQVRMAEEKSLVKANCLAWFNSHSAPIRAALGDDLLEEVDSSYKTLLAAADRDTLRSRYDDLLKGLKSLLSGLRQYAVSPPKKGQNTTDDPPSFDPLVPDPAMQGILARRWKECTCCVSHGAPLAATVMMGGLLEALLLARIHREKNQTVVFNAKSAPKDKTTGKTLKLQEWGLRNYIDVAHELAWITSSAKDIGEVVRDYRNYIHPHKELAHAVQLQDSDARLFWEVSKAIARQVLDGAAK